MKTARETSKNICKTGPFLGVCKYIQIAKPQTPYLSGVPPSRRSKIQPERAVNMAEFRRFNGTLL